jgi:DNA-binding PadR family transcriptional regulator
LSVALEEARQVVLSAEANEPDAVRFALTEKGRQALEEHQQAKANAE